MLSRKNQERQNSVNFKNRTKFFLYMQAWNKIEFEWNIFNQGKLIKF